MNKGLVFSLILFLFIGFNNSISHFNILPSFAQNITKENAGKTSSWISKRDNLNITMSLSPSLPVTDQNTTISFEIKKLNNAISSNYANLSGRVVIVDSDGRLFKFGNQSITDNKLSINYIFPSNGEDRIILELYKNQTPFTIGSFNLNVTTPNNQQNNNFFTNLFKGL
jgi:hypothetical protein